MFERIVNIGVEIGKVRSRGGETHRTGVERRRDGGGDT